MTIKALLTANRIAWALTFAAFLVWAATITGQEAAITHRCAIVINNYGSESSICLDRTTKRLQYKIMGKVTTKGQFYEWLDLWAHLWTTQRR